MTRPIYSNCYIQGRLSVNKQPAGSFYSQRLLRLSLLLGLALLTTTLAAGCFSGRAGKDRSANKYPLSGKSYVINGQRYYILASANGYREKGQASWYGEPFHGRKTANGETYNMHQISAAHKTLPLNTWVEVHNLDNKKKMCLRINDRGPFVAGRIIDLSQAAAKELGVHGPGLAKVVVTAITDTQRIEQLKVASNKLPASKPAAASKKAAAAAPAAKKPAVQTARKPVGSSPPASGNNYLVYVARTHDPDKAQNLADKISRQFKTVKIRVSYEQGQPYFQVRVEGFDGFNQAKAAQTQLAKLGYANASVINN